MDLVESPLLTDLYQLNMIQAYLDEKTTGTAVFEFFVRKLPPRRSFLIAAGLEQVLGFLESARFSESELAWLASTGRFGHEFLSWLAAFRFTGDVDAMPEGTAFFPNEPILRVTAPLPEAQLIETRLINLLHFQSLIAAKAARMVLAPRTSCCRFRPAACAWNGRGTLGCPCELYCRLCGHCDGVGQPSSSGYRCLAPWRTRSSRPTMTKRRHSRRLLVRGPNNLVLLIDTYDTRQLRGKS